jgi:hypothetical protein
MTDEEKQRELAAHDADFQSGAVEDGKRDMIDKQILPVWASTEPFGYEGSPADAQAVGGHPEGEGEGEAGAGKAHARRDVIGPGAD